MFARSERALDNSNTPWSWRPCNTSYVASRARRIHAGHFSADEKALRVDRAGGSSRGMGSAIILLSLFARNLGGLARGIIVGALPFAFDLDAALRRRMAKARIRPRQRILADFRQDVHPHGGFLVGGRVRYLIGVAAGQAVHRAFR